MNVITMKPRAVALPGQIVPLAEQFLSQLAARNYSHHTVAAYQRDLERFAGYLAGRDLHYVQTVGQAVIEDYLTALATGEGLSSASCGRALSSVKALYAFAVGRGLLTRDADPAADIKPPKLRRTPRIAPECSAIMDMIARIPRTRPRDLRDRALLLVLFDSGLRVSGLLGLDLFERENPPAHCVLPGGTVRYCAKGGQTKESVVGETTMAALAAWVEIRHRFQRDPRGEPALWLSERGGRLTRQQAHNIVRSRGLDAGIRGLHAHLLRHARVGDVMQRGDVHMAQLLAGHASKATTVAVYGQQADERVRQRIRTLCPIEGYTEQGAA